MIKVVLNATLNVKPAHNSFITKTGKGSNWHTALCDAVRQLAKDVRLKGQRADKFLPGKFTVNMFRSVEEDYEDE